MNKKSDLSKTKLYNPLQINESHLSTTFARSTSKYLTNCCYNFCQKNNSGKVIMQPKLLLFQFYDDSRWWNTGIYSCPQLLYAKMYLHDQRKPFHAEFPSQTGEGAFL
jgi:hypothetical protein